MKAYKSTPEERAASAAHHHPATAGVARVRLTFDWVDQEFFKGTHMHSAGSQGGTSWPILARSEAHGP